MAKKIRFPLEMDNNIKVRSMEELRNNFSLIKVLEYVKNDKLVTWLRDRYENDLAEAIMALDKTDSDLPRKVCAIFDIPYDEELINKVAFNQDELYDLLDEDEKEIYLCGDRFEIPLAVSGVTYKGINNPTVVINSKTEVDWISKEIKFEAIKYDEKYQMVLDNANAIKKVLYKELVEGVKKQPLKITFNKTVADKTELSFLIPKTERESVKRMYTLAKDIIENINYDVDADTVKMKKIVHDNNLIGLADKFIKEL